MNTLKNLSPIAISVLLSLAFVILIAGLGGSIAGSYVLMVHYVHSFTIHQQAVQAKAGIPICKALKDLASIHGGHVKANGYGAQLQVAFRHLYDSSHCAAVLSGHFKPTQ